MLAMRDASPVTVRLVYLARLREAFAASGESMAITGGADATVASVIEHLRQRGGAYASELAVGRNYRVAVNHTLVTPGHPVREGDELALFPPVTGG